MTTSIAQLSGRVMFNGLEAVMDWLQPEMVHYAVVQELNVLTMQAGTSTTNRLLSVTAQFSPTTTEYDISSLVGKGTPAWVETLVGGQWRPVRVVNYADLSYWYDIGGFAVAFQGDNENPTKQFINFSYQPQVPVRIHYDMDFVRMNLEDESPLPDGLSELVVLKSQNRIIPEIQAKIAVDLRRKEILREDVQILFATMSALKSRNVNELIPPLEALFKTYAFRSSGGEVSFTKLEPRGDLLYGGNNGFGSGYGY